MTIRFFLLFVYCTFIVWRALQNHTYNRKLNMYLEQKCLTKKIKYLQVLYVTQLKFPPFPYYTTPNSIVLSFIFIILVNQELF